MASRPNDEMTNESPHGPPRDGRDRDRLLHRLRGARAPAGHPQRGRAGGCFRRLLGPCCAGSRRLSPLAPPHQGPPASRRVIPAARARPLAAPRVTGVRPFKGVVMKAALRYGWRMRLHVIQGVIALSGLVTVAACGKGEEKGGAPKATTEPAPAGSGTETQPAAPAYAELDSVPNAGVIKGTVTYTGTKQAPALNVTKDASVCTHGGQPDGSLEVKDGKLKNAVVAITDPIAQGKKWEFDKIVLDNKECAFEPRVQIAREGGKVEVTNSDQLLHN